MEFPMQPKVTDEEGVERFKTNPLVSYLLDAGPFDLNDLARLQHTMPRWAYSQFAQLIGYSVDGWGTLSYVSDEEYEAAVAEPPKGE